MIALALLGLGTSVAALVVHYRLMTDPSYSSFCDISESVSCRQVLQSSYATVAGIPDRRRWRDLVGGRAAPGALGHAPDQF